MTESADNWRSIRCSEVQWEATPGVSRGVAWNIYSQCQPARAGNIVGWWVHECRWDSWTLGALADAGELQWRRDISHCGPVTIEAIKLTIDYAAAGHCVTLRRDAYKPRPWKQHGQGQ